MSYATVWNFLIVLSDFTKLDDCVCINYNKYKIFCSIKDLIELGM